MLKRLRFKDIHRRALVIDTHCDSILDHVSGQRNLGEKSSARHLDLPRLIEAGVRAQFMACYIEPEYKPERGLARALTLIDGVYRLAEDNPTLAAIARTAGEIKEIADSGRVALVISIEGGEGLGAGKTEDLLAALRILYRLGVRCLSLTWNQRNLLADGIGESATRGGLTETGVAVVKEMNRLGMIVDVSHLSEAGFWHLMEISKKPLIASHSNARALCEHKRNLSDDQIRHLARRGGVVGITFATAFLDREVARANLERVIDHVEYVANLVGVDHVGIGSDFDGIDATPAGLSDVTSLPVLSRGLLRRGFSEEQVHKIMGGNHLRLIGEIVG